MYVMPTSNFERTIKLNRNNDELLDDLLECLSALKCQDRFPLEVVIKHLKQLDGESWAVGEMLNRILLFIENNNGFVPDQNDV